MSLSTVTAEAAIAHLLSVANFGPPAQPSSAPRTPDWWKNETDEQRREYVQQHPRSKLAKNLHSQSGPSAPQQPQAQQQGSPQQPAATQQPSNPPTLLKRPKNPNASKSLQPTHVDERGSWPEHITALRIPPAWTDLKINHDPNGDLLVLGRDKKGKLQPIYSAKFAASQAALKFHRIKELESKMPEILEQNGRSMASKDPVVQDHGECAALVMTMGIRPGSTTDNHTEHQAYGATTLLGQHVVVQDGRTSLQFVGKHGVNITLPVEDANIAKMLQRRKEAAGDTGQLFPNVSDSSLSNYCHSLDGGSFTTKDFRTLLGTQSAFQMVEGMALPRNEKEYKKATSIVAKHVSSKLGNTPKVALDSYISPCIFASWRAAIGAGFKPQQQEQEEPQREAARLVLRRIQALAANFNEADHPRGQPENKGEFAPKSFFKGTKVVGDDGKPLTVYHGTTADFTEFRPNFRKGEQLGFGIHFAVDPGVASRYADPDQSGRKRSKGGRVFAVHLNIQKPLDANTIVRKGSEEFALAKKLAGSRLMVQKDENGVPCAYMQNAIDATNPKRAEQLIKQAGYDGIKYNAKVISPRPGGYVREAESISYIVFDASQIRPAIGRAKDEIARLLEHAEWKEDDHPRGQPENKGEFAPKNSGEGIDALNNSREMRTANARGGWTLKHIGERPRDSWGRPRAIQYLIEPDDIPDDWKRSERRKDRVEYYDPKYAHEEKEDVDIGTKIVTTTRVVPNEDYDAEFPEEAEPDTLYRGMSWGEYQDALKKGYFKSRGDLNIGDFQKNITMWSDSPRQARSYANGFAPWQFKATPSRPAVVVAVKGVDPKQQLKYPGLSNEIGIHNDNAVKTDSISHVFLGHPAIIGCGRAEAEDRDGEYNAKHLAGLSSYVRWEKEQPQSATATIQELLTAEFREEDHPRGQPGNAGQFVEHRVYHGTTQQFEGKPKVPEFDYMIDRMLGVHVAKDPAISNSFVEDFKYGMDKEELKSGGRVIPYKLQERKFITVPQERYANGNIQSDQDAIEKLVCFEGYKQDPSILARYLNQARNVPEDQAKEWAQRLVDGETVEMPNEGYRWFRNAAGELEKGPIKSYDLDSFVQDFRGKPFNAEDSKKIVQLARDKWQSEGYQGIKYINTSPMEMRKATDPTCFVVFDPEDLKDAYSATAKIRNLLSTAAADWWERLNNDERKAYVTIHPKSKYARDWQRVEAPKREKPALVEQQTTTSTPVTFEEIADTAQRVCSEIQFPIKAVVISEEDSDFMLNGKNYKTAGKADLDTGEIIIYRKNIDKETLAGTIVYEVMHQRFRKFQVKYRGLYKTISKIKPPRGKKFWETVMDDKARLRKPYDSQYPEYVEINKVYMDIPTNVFARSDGVSEYSRDWWEAFDKKKAKVEIAMHETLAEMARIKYETGKFPEHQSMGTNLAITKGVEAWRDLFNAVEKFGKETS